jgi:hypothetical protein
VIVEVLAFSVAINVSPARMSDPYGSTDPEILHFRRTVDSLAKTDVVSVIPVVRMPFPEVPLGPVEKTASSVPLDSCTEHV